MQPLARLEPVEYLVIGHITIDLTANGARLGGSAAYAALTAKALGWRPGIVTAWAEELSLGPLEDVPIINIGAEHSTTFENIYTTSGRKQRIHGDAPFIDFHMIPEVWRNPKLIHLAPVAREVSPRILKYVEDAFIAVTPQGWLRQWDEAGRVRVTDWEEGELVLAQADAAVIGRQDVNGDAAQIERLAAACPTLVVTEGKAGATLYSQGEELHIEAPFAEEVDPTGAGDIFAAAFFTRMYQSGEPLDAARFAAQLAALSVTRPGLKGTPTQDEIHNLMAEAL